MATYEYENEQGETLEIILPMSADKPAAIVMVAGEWEEVDPDSNGAFVRKFGFKGARVSRGSGVIAKKGLPVTRTMPLVKRKPGDGSEVKKQQGHTIVQFPDGTRTNAMGQRIIADKKDEARACAQTGFVRNKDM